MKTSTHNLIVGVLCALGGVCHGAHEGEVKDQIRYSTNIADQVECKRKLNIIYGAIQEYRTQHGGALPDKLSSLVPEFINDANVLVCPHVQAQRGGLREWRKRFRDLAGDSSTSYSYEMPLTELDHSHWRGLPRKTWREFKERQQKELEAEFGLVVPIVRCLNHRPCLNLALGAQIYESGSYWEEKFSQDEHLLTVARLFQVKSSDRVTDGGGIPTRDTRAGPRLIDLSLLYNARLNSDWQGFKGNNFAALPAGLHTFDGIEFDVRGVIQLQGTELPVVFPREVGGIKVAQKADRIHFLHGLSFPYRANTVQATYSINYVNGEVREFPVIYGQQIADWWHKPGASNLVSNAKVAWTGSNEASIAYGMATSMYHAVWENPLSEIEIESITVDAGVKKFLSGPFVIAITLE